MWKRDDTSWLMIEQGFGVRYSHWQTYGLVLGDHRLRRIFRSFCISGVSSISILFLIWPHSKICPKLFLQRQAPHAIGCTDPSLYDCDIQGVNSEICRIPELLFTLHSRVSASLPAITPAILPIRRCTIWRRGTPWLLWILDTSIIAKRRRITLVLSPNAICTDILRAFRSVVTVAIDTIRLPIAFRQIFNDSSQLLLEYFYALLNNGIGL